MFRLLKKTKFQKIVYKFASFYSRVTMVLRSYFIVNIVCMLEAYTAFTKVRNLASNRKRFEWTEWAFEHFLNFLIFMMRETTPVIEHLMNLSEQDFQNNRIKLARFYQVNRNVGSSLNGRFVPWRFQYWANYAEFKSTIYGYRPTFRYLRSKVVTLWGQSCRRGIFDYKSFLYSKIVEGFPVRQEWRRTIEFPAQWTSEYLIGHKLPNNKYIYSEFLSFQMAKEFYAQLFTFLNILPKTVLAAQNRIEFACVVPVMLRGSGVFHIAESQIKEIRLFGWHHKNAFLNPVFPHHMAGYISQYFFDTNRESIDYSDPQILKDSAQKIQEFRKQEKKTIVFANIPELKDCPYFCPYNSPGYPFASELIHGRILEPGYFFPRYSSFTTKFVHIHVDVKKRKADGISYSEGSLLTKQPDGSFLPLTEDEPEHVRKYFKIYDMKIPDAFMILKEWR